MSGRLRQVLLYLDDLLYIVHPYIEQTVIQMYYTELQLNKSKFFDREAPLLDLEISITHGMIDLKFKINKRILILK